MNHTNNDPFSSAISLSLVLCCLFPTLGRGNRPLCCGQLFVVYNRSYILLREQWVSYCAPGIFDLPAFPCPSSYITDLFQPKNQQKAKLHLWKTPFCFVFLHPKVFPPHFPALNARTADFVDGNQRFFDGLKAPIRKPGPALCLHGCLFFLGCQ